ncbi:MAG: thiamine pyrophosphate-binding protein [Lachnospiraceae bacterium]|nr:thiamine pyrophosphate-binding protein [Lachnospiraceae bacterium]
MDVNQAIVKILEESGRVSHVFGSTGQVNASMLLALRDSDKIKTIVVRNEQAASFMACGYTMFNPDNLGVCFATGGPGAFNLFSGMAVAYSDSLPIIGITGYASAGVRGKGCLNESTGLSRTPDSHKMFSATTKKSYIVEDASQICDIMEDAINTALGGRPGPVHVHVPKDITIAEVPNFRSIKIDVKPVKAKEKAAEEFAARLIRGVENKENLLLLAGYGCIRAGAREDLLKLIDTYRIPFVTTMDAKGYLPEDHPLSLGVYGTTGDPAAMDYFDKADVVLAVGNSFAENATLLFKEDLYDGKTLMHINIDPHEINKVYAADLSMVSDAHLALESILTCMDRLKEGITPLDPSFPADRKKWFDMPNAGSPEKMHPADVARAISEVAPENAIIMGDAGSHMLWLSQYMKLTGDQRYQNPGSFGPMASHTNGCIGVKCANPDKVVISGSGDGCYLMAGFELLTAVQNNIPVVWVIFNNGEFNVIKKFLLNMFNEHAYMSFMNPDYVAFAEACGATGMRATNKDELKEALNKAIAMNKPVVIDAVIDGEVYANMNKSM